MIKPWQVVVGILILIATIKFIYWLTSKDGDSKFMFAIRKNKKKDEVSCERKKGKTQVIIHNPNPWYVGVEYKLPGGKSDIFYRIDPKSSKKISVCRNDITEVDIKFVMSNSYDPEKKYEKYDFNDHGTFYSQRLRICPGDWKISVGHGIIHAGGTGIDFEIQRKRNLTEDELTCDRNINLYYGFRDAEITFT